MSRQPPLPPGPPPPSGYGDSYRPGQQNYQFGQNSSSNRGNDIYQFGGNNQRNDRGPSRDFDYRSVPPPGLSSNGGDSYRPSDGGFSFRQPPPPGVDFSQGDSYRPHTNLRQRPRDRRTGDRGRGRGGYRGRASKRASDRPMLNSTRAPTPELMHGMDEDEAAAARFRDLDDVSDSEEAEMEMSSEDEDQDDGEEQPRKKQARVDTKAADADSVPRWSNPDPYTALPPPDESQRKKKDVVKLIRKARVIASADDTAKSEAATDDFISFDFGDEEQPEEESDNESEQSIPAGAPTGPRFSHRDHIQGQLPSQFPPNDVSTTTPVSKRQDDDSALGSRKRTYDDEIKPPPFIASFKASRFPSKGGISSEWKKNSMTDPTPWCKIDHSNTELVGLRLHKEIMDFYVHFKPRDFEEEIRHRLVSNLREFVRNEIGDADIRCFGSFPAGLYLPTADMDLVLVSDTYMKGGRARYDSKNTLYKFRQMLEREGIAAKNSTEVISKAKVPLVKYVDRLTGLKVDVSFENDTGIIANKTFQDWRNEFPAMPVLVTLIKQFLAMRGLNEPVNGGIGGFTVTCLVVSMLQTMPQVQSRNLIPEHNLGEMLMEFFNLYGKKFNANVTAIQFDPPGLVPKSRIQSQVYNKPSNITKFSIIDPNNSSNDIAGGSSNTRTIIDSFAAAHDDLQQAMAAIYSSQTRVSGSVLGCIIGGNYRSFDLQREHLLHIYERLGPVDGKDERRF